MFSIHSISPGSILREIQQKCSPGRIFDVPDMQANLLLDHCKSRAPRLSRRGNSIEARGLNFWVFISKVDVLPWTWDLRQAKGPKFNEQSCEFLSRYRCRAVILVSVCFLFLPSSPVLFLPFQRR